MNFSIFTTEKILCILHGQVFVMDPRQEKKGQHNVKQKIKRHY